MSELVEYYNNLPKDTKKIEIISKTFINFYLYFKNLNEKKLILDNTMYFLDSALDFSEPVFENSNQEDYLNTKQFQIEQFLAGIKLQYNKIIKNFKKTFDIPSNYSYEEVCNLIEQSYIAYASLRYKQNLLNSKEYEETFHKAEMEYKFPQYIPDTNANISEFLEMVNGIKILPQDGKTYEWFNIFSPSLHIRVIVDITDGQIAALFINEEEYTDVPSSFIKKIKQHIKSGTPLPKVTSITQKK